MKLDLCDHTQELMHNNNNLDTLLEIVDDLIFDLVEDNVHNKTVEDLKEGVCRSVNKFYVILKALRAENEELRKNLRILWDNAVCDESPEEKNESVGECETLAVEIKTTYEV